MQLLSRSLPLLSFFLALNLGWAQAPAQSASVTQPRAATKAAAPAATSPAKPAQAKIKGATATRKTAKPSPQRAEEQLSPPRPLTPEQLPATRPTVSYRNGQLTVVANNSTMAEVLNQVRAQTGANIEMSGVAASDRVYAKLGPGAPKDVLAALLEGSRFNYAILGSDTDAGAIQRVVLMPKAGGAQPATTVAATPAQPMTRLPQPQADEEMTDEEPPPEEEPPPAEAQPEPAQPEQPQGQPGQPKTPEQLLQELQRMQQQQQQQQNPQGQPQNPNPQQQIPDREIPDEESPQ